MVTAYRLLIVAAAVAFLLAVAVRLGFLVPSSVVPFVVGETVLPVHGVDFSAGKRTVLLYLRSDCNYCTASMNFYRRVAECERNLVGN